MGNRRLNSKIVADALERSKGAVYLAAKSLDCSHTTIYKYIKKYPKIAAMKDYYDEEVTDIAALKLREAVERGEPWAIKMQLMTKGKGRGYTERTEFLNTQPVEIVVSYANKPKG